MYQKNRMPRPHPVPKPLQEGVAQAAINPHPYGAASARSSQHVQVNRPRLAQRERYVARPPGAAGQEFQFQVPAVLRDGKCAVRNRRMLEALVFPPQAVSSRDSAINRFLCFINITAPERRPAEIRSRKSCRRSCFSRVRQSYAFIYCPFCLIDEAFSRPGHGL